MLYPIPLFFTTTCPLAALFPQSILMLMDCTDSSEGPGGAACMEGSDSISEAARASPPKNVLAKLTQGRGCLHPLIPFINLLTPFHWNA